MATNSKISVRIDQKMQLTGCDYGNEMRNAIRVARNVLTSVALLFIPILWL